MAWLLHPDDFDRLVALAKPWAPCPPDVVDETRDARLAELKGIAAPYPGIVVSRCYVLARGHIQDTAHPEIGAPTFAEYGAEHEKIMDAERRRFDEGVALLEKHLAPMRSLSFPVGPSVALNLDKP